MYCSLVDSVDFQQLSHKARLVFLTARLSPQAGPAAIFRYYPSILAEQTGLPLRDVDAAARELVEAGWAALEDGVLWLINALKYDPTMRLHNPKHRAAVVRALEALPGRPIVARFCEYYGVECLSHRHSKGYPGLGSPNTEVLPETTRGTTREPKKTEDREPLATGRPAAALTSETWEAYAGAYKRRYGVQPIRNAKTNAQLAQLVKRLPAAESGPVAAYYVAHSAQRYVRAGHPVGLLLYDAEKLRTEWATGQRITETGARAADERQERGGVAQRLLAKAQAQEAQPC